MALLRNWSEQRALTATLRRLKKIDDLWIEIGGLWGDVDQSIVNIADDRRRDIETDRTDIVTSVQERAERLASEEDG